MTNFGEGVYQSLPVSICTLDALITTLDVEYRQSQTFGTSLSRFRVSPPPSYINATEPRNITDAALLSSFPAGVLTRAVLAGQSVTGNVVANTLASFISSSDEAQFISVLVR